MQTVEQNRNSWVSQFWRKIWMKKKEKQSFNNRDCAMLYLTFEITKKKMTCLLKFSFIFSPSSPLLSPLFLHALFFLSSFLPLLTHADQGAHVSKHSITHKSHSTNLCNLCTLKHWLGHPSPIWSKAQNHTTI
jgi:hypothetical protein